MPPVWANPKGRVRRTPALEGRLGCDLRRPGRLSKLTRFGPLPRPPLPSRMGRTEARRCHPGWGRASDAHHPDRPPSAAQGTGPSGYTTAAAFRRRVLRRRV